MYIRIRKQIEYFLHQYYDGYPLINLIQFLQCVDKHI